MAGNFNVRKMYSTVERMAGWKYSAEKTIVPLKECIAVHSQISLEINILLLTPVKIYTVPFKELMTAILSVAKSDTLRQGMDGCNMSVETYRLPLKNRMLKIGLPKK